MDITITSQGFGLGISLIAAIGAQNSYVLKRGILKNNVFVTALTCFLIDATLITLGVFGLGKVIEGNDLFMLLATTFGVIFLTIYGLSSFKNALKKGTTMNIDEESSGDSMKKVIVTILALSLLNPHVYLDTVLLIGSIGSKYPAGQKLDFLIGTISASFVWFFGLAYGSRVLIPIFKKEITWKILDIFIGVIMLLIAKNLVSYSIDNNLISALF